MRALAKWDRFGTSIFSVMTQKAQALGAVNLAQGFPDFDGPDALKDAAAAALRSGMNQYAPSTGLLPLRKLLAARQKARTGLAYDPDTEVTVLSGATEALYCAFQAYFEPFDEIIAFEPSYDSYTAGAFAAGAKLVGVPLRAPDWRFDPAELAAKITPRTRGIIVNTPHNPTGRVLGREELQLVRDLCVKHDLVAITDEVYEELVYDDATHLSLATLPGMDERTLTISSTSKTFSMTGWKVGYAFGRPALTKPLRAVHQFTVFCSATPLQAGMIAALELGEGYFDELRRDYVAKRDRLVGILQRAGFGAVAPKGTYFVLADYAPFSDADDLSFCTWLLETAKVAAIPISAFHEDPAAAARRQKYVRFAFCKGEATLAAADERLSTLKGRRQR